MQRHSKWRVKAIWDIGLVRRHCADAKESSDHASQGERAQQLKSHHLTVGLFDVLAVVPMFAQD